MAEFSGEDLICRRGERFVFSALGFRALAGEAVMLTGRNGAGKSSLLRMMAGLLPPYAGRLCWDGAPVGDDPEAHRARLHYVGHQDAVKPVLSVRDNLLLWARLRGVPRPEAAVEAALDALALGPLIDTPGRYLSSGQKRRTALARILLGDTALWLLDEPTVGLDRQACRRLEGLIDAHRARGGMVVFSTHVPLSLEQPRSLDLDAYALAAEELSLYEVPDAVVEAPA